MLLRDVGDILGIEDGVAAVCGLLRSVILVVASGDEARRRKVDVSAVTRGGDSARVELGGEREDVLVAALILSGRGLPFDKFRDLGDGGEADDRETGDNERTTPFGDWGGDVVLAICEVDVAWCLSVGGAVAITFAFARLAAIAAATLLFLLVLAVTVGKRAAFSGFGHVFSSCLRATESRVSKMALPRSCHTSSKTQKHSRVDSLTAGLGSTKDFFNDLSKICRPPEDSRRFFERWPWTVK
jgi:hypothetical protein